MTDNLSIGIDYLTLILPTHTQKDSLALIDNIGRIFSDSYDFFQESGRFIGRQFSHWARSSNGGLIVWNLPGENGESLTSGSMRIALGGTVLSRASVSAISKLISSVFAENGKCTRIDLKCDDYLRLMHPDLLESACQNGNYTGFSKSTKHSDLSSDDVYEAGWTLYFGSRTSDRYTRYYNAKPLHGIAAWRYETEYKNGIANEIALMISSTQDDDILVSLIAANIAGNITFVDRSSGARASRCPFLDFWQSFIDRLGSSVRLSIPLIIPTIQKSIEWLETRVSATLAVVSEYYGYSELELFRRLKRLGISKMNSRHYALLETSSREPYKELVLSDDSLLGYYQYIPE